MRQTLLWSVSAALISLAAAGACAQDRDGALSEREIEKLRDAAYVPVDRIKVYEDLLDSRARRMQDLLAKPRHPGRETDLHDLIEQFGDIASECNENLDEYEAKHRDLRKALPKLIDATDRWATVLRAPAEDAAYRVVRRIALDALAELKTSAQTAQTEEVAYFKEHPEAEKAEQQKDRRGGLPEPIDIPR